MRLAKDGSRTGAMGVEARAWAYILTDACFAEEFEELKLAEST